MQAKPIIHFILGNVANITTKCTTSLINASTNIEKITTLFPTKRLTSGMESFWSSPISTLFTTAILKESIPTNTAT